MASNIVNRLKLMPLLMGVAALAFGLRAFDVYTGLELLNAPVQAQDQPSEQEDTAENLADKAVQETVEGNVISEVEPQDTPNRPPIVVGLPNDEEMELITQLRQRRETLESRSTSIDLQEKLLESTEKRINQKIIQLEVLEERIKSHLRLFEEKETEQLQSIVSIYETMKPKEAAPRFEALSLQTQLDLVQLMNPRKVAALMEKMTPRKASVLTTELATKAQPPSIGDVGK